MAFVRRLAVVVSLVLCGLLAFSATSLAVGILRGGAGGGGGGFFSPAGHFHDNTISASFFVFGDPRGQLSVTVTVINNVDRPKVGPPSTIHETDVQFQACSFAGGPCGGGCFIPDGATDFTFSADFSSAKLSTTVNVGTTKTCQNNPLTFTPPLTFTVDGTWTGSPATSQFTVNARYACSGYKSESTTTSTGGNNINAIGMTSLLPGITFGPTGGNVNSFDQVIHAKGVALETCPPLGGKGAGPGPQAPGKYHFVSQSAFAPVTPNDPTQSTISMNAVTFTNVSHPTGGPVTTHTETDLNLIQFSFFGSNFDCWVIPSTDLTFTRTGATLHAAIDQILTDPNPTPVCQGVTNTGFPPTFNIDAVWTNTGPVGKLKTDISSGCAASRFTSDGKQNAQNGSASGGITGVADSFTTTNGTIVANDNSFEITGGRPC